MKKVKVFEAQGAALDWLVAKCEGHLPEYHRNYTVAEERDGIRWYTISIETLYHREGRDFRPKYSPSSDWSQGGPIIEQNLIQLHTLFHIDSGKVGWFCEMPPGFVGRGYTPLVAAMRCYVASKMGEEVEVPDELSETVRGEAKP